MQSTAMKMDNDWQRKIIQRWQKDAPVVISDVFREEFQRKCAGEILFHEPMARHTYIKIGGSADIFFKPQNRESIIQALRLAEEHNVPVVFHGSGANTLVKDGGVRGLVISLYGTQGEMEIVESSDDFVDVKCDAGVAWSRVVRFARDLCASGLEPLVGIPGSVGGLVRMNAGTREREMKDVVRSATFLHKDGTFETVSREKLDFEYRDLKMPRTSLIVEVILRLEKGHTLEEIDARLKKFQDRRVETQPLEYPNLGSMFKNPLPVSKNDLVVSAGKLIEEAGLKNVRVGGARISPKHANFIVNEGGATAKDVLTLIGLIKDRVKSLHGIQLETEVKIIGEDLN